MSWITDDWRLKLLALALAVLMLGAVAFSQNPTATRTLTLPLSYTPVGANQNLVILNRPSTVNVTFSGLADAVVNATTNNFSATVEAQQAKAGPAVKLNVTVTTTANVTIQQPAPIVVRVDNLVAETIPVKVATHSAPGWVVTKTDSNPASVTFVGPQSWEPVTATVNVTDPIAANQRTFVNQTIQLTNSSGSVLLTPCSTVPCAGLDFPTANVAVNAETGTTRTTVVLVVPEPSQPPPPGFELTRIDIKPLTVVITGDPAALAKIQSLTLPAVDLSKSTSTFTAQVNIPYPDGVTPLNGIATAKVTFTIVRNPSVSPSP
ncbi:MAG TPA: CdaR family protein [Candidatus Dormibacteraeota bacterium]|nr:CdaR family protein [Candidatus Dormibacteraeota bacterium]